MRSKWLWIALCLGVIVAVSVWLGLSWLEERRCQRELRQAEGEMARGLYHLARQRLSDLIKRRPKRSEAAYELGLCEQALGHAQAAADAWSLVGPESPFAAAATLARSRLYLNVGRFTPAESLLRSLPRGASPQARETRQALELLLRLEGRKDEVRDVILETWQQSDDPGMVLRRLYLLENGAFPIDYVRSTLGAGDPGDDRVWLGKADLARWSGHFDEAARLLAACIECRPDDPAVWRAQLALAQASGDIEKARAAAGHLPLDRFTGAEVLQLRAWLASRLGQFETESSVLEELVSHEPDNISALDRLAELALMAGKGSEADAFRKKKEQFNRLREEYKTLVARDDRVKHAKELASLAEQLGRRTEARGWTLIAQGRGGSGALVPAATADTNVGQIGNPPRGFEPAQAGDSAGSAHGERLSSRLADLFGAASTSPMTRAADQPASTPLFSDDSEAAGLHFTHDNGHSRRNPPPPEAMCGGVALFDYDGDGWLDVYVVQGGPFPPVHSAPNTGDRLFRNRGDGTFEDVSARSGIASFPGGYGHGVTVGDFDNDGCPDLFVTRWRSYALYRNKGDGTFEDVTDRSGLGGDRDWPTSAAFADLDGDGDLDLYVCHYLLYDPSKPKRCEHPEAPSKHECNPLDFPFLPDHVFRNDRGHFVDVTSESGFIDSNGRGLGVLAANLDDDNRIDLYVANDMTANYLFHNLGGFHFEETGQIAGVAASSDGGFKAGMGIACGDLDGDGKIDLAVTNYFGESTTFYRNLGQGYFSDQSNAIGLAAATRPLLGFGIAFFDADNDGRLDVLSANGHVLDARPRFPWMMPMQLLQGGAGGRLNDVSSRAGTPFAPLHLGRGLATGDLDNDGKVDALAVAQNEPLVYLHNRTGRPGHFITFELRGARSNRDAVGARITVSSGGRLEVAERFGGGSYQSASDPRLHFGLGGGKTIDSVEIRWPSGQLDRLGPLRPDHTYVLRERKGTSAISEGAIGRD
jgi:tetratricopeptide (TPR) repeat protein